MLVTLDLRRLLRKQRTSRSSKKKDERRRDGISSCSLPRLTRERARWLTSVSFCADNLAPGLLGLLPPVLPLLDLTLQCFVVECDLQRAAVQDPVGQSEDKGRVTEYLLSFSRRGKHGERQTDARESVGMFFFQSSASSLLCCAVAAAVVAGDEPSAVSEKRRRLRRAQR